MGGGEEPAIEWQKNKKHFNDSQPVHAFCTPRRTELIFERHAHTKRDLSKRDRPPNTQIEKPYKYTSLRVP